MVHIFSDDSYFSLGVHALLKQNGYQAKVVNLKKTSGVESDDEDVFLLSSDNGEVIDAVYFLASAKGNNIVNMVRGDVVPKYGYDASMPGFYLKKSVLMS